jgi:hypothetical protein
VSIKKQIKKLEQYEVKHRSTFERYGALLLTVATLFGSAQLGHDHTAQLAKKDVVFQSRVSLNSAAENETVRMPVKFDDGLRATATMGE